MRVHSYVGRVFRLRLKLRRTAEALAEAVRPGEHLVNDDPIDIRRQMDAIYGDLAPDRIPWNRERPPALLVALVESKWVVPCDAVDLGCGAGNYAVWLASQGFRVTGLDISPHAVALAEDLGRRRGVSCRFLACDLLGDVSRLHGSFDFAYDWEVLHHAFPEDRPAYVRNVHRLLRPGGAYFSACFSERDASFGGAGKYRTTGLGTRLYFSSEDEMRALLEPLFGIEDLRTLEIEGTPGPHLAVVVRMRRRGRPGPAEAGPYG